jgi:pilus assembly protein CpaB
MALLENKKQIFILIAAIAIGLVAAVLVGQFVQNTINENTAVIAKKFEKEQKKKDEIYNQQMQGLNQKIAEVEQNSQKAVQAALKAAQDQQQMKAAEVKKEKKFVSLALRMPAGKRALTIKIDSLGAVGGLLSPGDYVDVIAQLNVPAADNDKKDKKDKKDSVTAMIFQNIQILAVNSNIDEPGVYDAQQKENALKLTFAVTPEEASLLSFAEKNGKIELALRSPNEKKPAMISAATWTTLAEYVLQNTGADLSVVDAHKAEAPVQIEDEASTEAAVKIYKGGKGIN